MKPNKILFLTLYTFSLTGGIEKVCRAMCRVLSLLQNEDKTASFNTLSLHDKNEPDEKYISSTDFTGFAGAKLRFAAASVAKGFKVNVVVLSHINLLLFTKIIKTLSPKTRIILIAHGIEVWGKLKPWKTQFIQKHVQIWAVSSFTSRKLVEVNNIPKSQIKILNNCLDPYFKLPKIYSKPRHLLIRYGLTEQDKIVYSLARLSSAEHYKGYDKVLEAMQYLPNVYYILAGKADEAEEKHVQQLVKKYSLESRVFIAGFILESELSDYYLMADVFAMPSSGEGFGISFIEAAACGCPTVAGNLDGSSDALLNGELGILVDPNNVEEIRNAIEKTLYPEKRSSSALLQKKCIEHFGFDQYKKRVLALLKSGAETTH